MLARVESALARLPSWAIPAFVFANALVLRIGTQVLVGFYEHPIGWEYDRIGQNISDRHGYYYDFLGTRWATYGLPALPLLDGALYIASGGTDRFVAIGLVLAMASAATAAFASLAAGSLAGRTAALIAGLGVAFHPGLILYAAQIHELSLETFVLGLALLAFLAELSRPRPQTLWAMAGAASLAVFIRPTYGAFVLAALGLLLIRRPRSLLRIAAVGLAIVVGTLPWTIRNTRELGPTGTPLGPYSCLALWMGNNPYSPGSTSSADGRSWWGVQPADVQARIYGKPEVEQGRIFCEEAARFATADPGRWVAWWATKWSWYWWSSPQAGLIYAGSSLRIYLALWLLALAFALFGLLDLWSRGQKWVAGLVLSLVVPISLAQSAVYVDGRHRLEVEWAVVSLSAVGIVAALGRVHSARARPRGRAN